MNSWWRMTTCVAVALVTTALAGCSAGTDAGPAPGASSDSGALNALRKAAKATEKAGSARFDGSSITGASTSTREGVLDWAHTPTTGRLVVTGSGTGAGQTLCLKKAVYQRVSDTVAASLGGKHWLKYGAAALGSAAQTLIAVEPAKPVKELLASGDVRKVRSQTVRGVRTTHYLGTTDTERIELWIDKHARVVKAIRQDDGSAGSTTTTAYYSGYGATVVVKAPPASDTVDYTALLGAQSVSPS